MCNKYLKWQHPPQSIIGEFSVITGRPILYFILREKKLDNLASETFTLIHWKYIVKSPCYSFGNIFDKPVTICPVTKCSAEYYSTCGSTVLNCVLCLLAGRYGYGNRECWQPASLWWHRQTAAAAVWKPHLEQRPWGYWKTADLCTSTETHTHTHQFTRFCVVVMLYLNEKMWFNFIYQGDLFWNVFLGEITIFKVELQMQNFFLKSSHLIINHDFLDLFLTTIYCRSSILFRVICHWFSLRAVN